MTRQGGYRLLAAGAVLVQLLLLGYFLVMGLGWGGFWYLANLAQAVAVLVVAGVLLWRHPLLVLPLPLLSILLMVVFQAIDPSTRATDCTPEELAAVTSIPPPAETPPPEFLSEPANGCIARFQTDLSGAEVLDHYRETGREGGWTVEPPGEVVTEPGEPAAEPSSLRLSDSTTTVDVSYERAGDEGPAREQVLVVVAVAERVR